MALLPNFSLPNAPQLPNMGDTLNNLTTLGGTLPNLGGNAGLGKYPTPAGFPIVNATSPDQLAQANAQTQGGLSSQQALLQALAGQNAIQNQGNVYRQQQGLANQMSQNNGLATQQAAAQGYQNIANGTGPNVAQNMLNQTTGQNVANQAALMAGQRGASANAGLMARQIAQQGAATQQQAAGQGATLQAQQQQAALGQMAGIGAQQAGQLQAQQGQMGNMANTQAANQIGQTNAGTQAAIQQQQNLMGAQGQYNQAGVGMQSNINAGNTQLNAGTQQGLQGLVGGLMGVAGGALAAMAGGGMVEDHSAYPGQSGFGAFMSQQNSGQAFSPQQQEQMQFNNQMKQSSQLENGATKLGSAIGSKMFSSDDEGDYARGGKVHNLKSGGKAVATSPTEKAKKPGNSYSNDTIPAMLSEGEVVIPRSVMQSGDPVSASAQFVAQVLAKRRVKK